MKDSYSNISCPCDHKPLKIHKKKSNSYFFVSCICGFTATDLSPEGLVNKVNKIHMEGSPNGRRS